MWRGIFFNDCKISIFVLALLNLMNNYLGRPFNLCQPFDYYLMRPRLVSFFATRAAIMADGYSIFCLFEMVFELFRSRDFVELSSFYSPNKDHFIQIRCYLQQLTLFHPHYQSHFVTKNHFNIPILEISSFYWALDLFCYQRSK